MNAVKRHWLGVLPDLPRWVETRDLLSREGSEVLENPTRTGFVVWSADRALGCVVGDPDPVALAGEAGCVPELLAFSDNVQRVRSLLPNHHVEPATLYSAPERHPAPPPHACRPLVRSEIVALDHLSADLSAQLSGAAEMGVSIVAAFDGTLPVAFAYVAAETESLWDVSIDTVESHRRRGYASAAVLHLMHAMKAKGKSAVWGAVESNRASSNLALRLGFARVDRLWLLTRRPSDRGA